MADDVDVANNGSSSCIEAPLCIGQDAADTPTPGGYAYGGTGTAPDRVFRFRVDSACTLSVSMLSTTRDLNISFSRGGCGNAPGDCSCVDDSDLGAVAEQLTGIDVVPLVDYYIIVDGYNTVDGDTFSLTITRTAGTCNFTDEVCGNGNVAAGEGCDDSNTTDCDGCHGDCSGFETGCGDGFLCDTEVCDDGDTVACDGCNGDCSVIETGCGDGVICAGESCDDSNSSSGDGCSASCTVEVPVVDSGTNPVEPDASATGGTTSDAAAPSPGGSSNGGSGNGGTGGNTSASGASNEQPDGSVSETAGTGGNGVGGRSAVDFGNFTAGTSGSSATAAPEKSSGCGCVTVGTERTAQIPWWTLVGLLTLVARRRRSH
jgi:MYXO-CTERM domain-containing protein